MTHDSIGLGEDGPTHQPVEHLAALRAIPNLVVLRPADALETSEAWQVALERRTGPSLIVLTRQNLACITAAGPDAGELRVARGAYEVAGATRGPAEASLFATGSEVEIAMAARQLLQRDGIAARVVSVPSFELFEAESEEYQAAVIGEAPVKAAIEAAVRQGWDRFIGSGGIFVGMTGFGLSGPYQELYEHFGITAEALAAKVRERVRGGTGI
jgi:transketolase